MILFFIRHGQTDWNSNGILQRVLTSIHKIILANTDNVVIVTHSAVIMCLQCYLTNTPFEEMMKFKAENTSITEIDSDLLKFI